MAVYCVNLYFMPVRIVKTKNEEISVKIGDILK